MPLFVDPRLLPADATRVGVAESVPPNGAIGLSTTTRVAVRFARPIDVGSANTDTVSITGPDGPVAVQVVVAEGGRLLFITPAAPLRPESSFDVALRGLRDAASRTRLAMNPRREGGCRGRRNLYSLLRDAYHVPRWRISGIMPERLAVSVDS